MSKLDAKVFSSITPFSKQWILGEETMYEFLYNYQDFLSDKYGIVDLGSLTWTYRPSGGAIRNSTFQSVTLKDIVKRTSGVADAYCSKYAIASWNQVGFQEFDKVISIASDGFINVGDSDAGTDPDAFKAAMNGVYLVFRLADNIGRVNLSNLTFSWYGENNCWYISSTWRKQGENNGWCENYSLFNSWLNMPNNSIYLRGDQKYIYVKTDGTQQVKPSGYLYFEIQIPL